jgi:hypothetical protein
VPLLVAVVDALEFSSIVLSPVVLLPVSVDVTDFEETAWLLAFPVPFVSVSSTNGT